MTSETKRVLVKSGPSEGPDGFLKKLGSFYTSTISARDFGETVWVFPKIGGKPPKS